MTCNNEQIRHASATVKALDLMVLCSDVNHYTYLGLCQEGVNSAWRHKDQHVLKLMFKLPLTDLNRADVRNIHMFYSLKLTRSIDELSYGYLTKTDSKHANLEWHDVALHLQTWKDLVWSRHEVFEDFVNLPKHWIALFSWFSDVVNLKVITCIHDHDVLFLQDLRDDRQTETCSNIKLCRKIIEGTIYTGDRGTNKKEMIRGKERIEKPNH